MYTPLRNVSRGSRQFCDNQQVHRRWRSSDCHNPLDQSSNSARPHQKIYHSDYYRQDRQQQRSWSSAFSSLPTLYIIRGLPGSGKSTLARSLSGKHGVILSTDDYFMTRHGYHFDPSALREAHDWNKSRTYDNLIKGTNPVVIDNTNLTEWEMKPYMTMAVEHGYEIQTVEPNTSWRYDANELAKRNCHNVPKETILNMLSRFEKNVTVESVLGKHLFDRYQQQCRDRSGASRVPGHQGRSNYSRGGYTPPGDYSRDHHHHSDWSNYRGGGRSVHNSSRGPNRGQCRGSNRGQCRGSNRGQYHQPSSRGRTSSKTTFSGSNQDFVDIVDTMQSLGLTSERRPATARSSHSRNGEDSNSNQQQRSYNRQNYRRPARGRWRGS